MKRLILLRHAKAAGKAAAADRDRVLADRGRREMKVIADEFASASLQPDLALVSPSARTRETWALVGRGEVATRFEERIYEASVDDLLTVIREVQPSVAALVMVGHNPGFEDLARELVQTGDTRMMADLRGDFPPASLAVIDFEIDAWDRVSPRTGRLVSFGTPASLAAGRDG